MKKVCIALCCAALLLSSLSAGYCEVDTITDGQQNGRYIILLTESKENFKGYSIAMNYCIGLIDAIKVMRGQEMLSELYGPRTTTGEIFEAVRLYYQNNPTQRNRSVIDVLLSGAK
jgi:hypothetical protein